MMSERGFTLLETLVAFAILAVTLVALYEAMGTSLRGFDRAAQVDQALMAAQSQFDELATRDVLSEDIGGAVEGTPFRWRVQLLPEAQPEPENLRVSPLRLQRVRLIVSWSDVGRARQIAIDKTLLVKRGPAG